MYFNAIQRRFKFAKILRIFASPRSEELFHASGVTTRLAQLFNLATLAPNLA